MIIRVTIIIVKEITANPTIMTIIIITTIKELIIKEINPIPNNL